MTLWRFIIIMKCLKKINTEPIDISKAALKYLNFLKKFLNLLTW